MEYILYAGFTCSVLLVFLIAAYIANRYNMEKTNKLILDQIMSICSARQRRYEEFACEKCELEGTTACAKNFLKALLDQAEPETKPTEDNAGISYHLSCPYCGYTWWSKDPFLKECPQCNMDNKQDVTT